jgi:hypothetical protein
LQIQWGRRLRGSERLATGRALRIRIPYGGQAKMRVVDNKGYLDRIYAYDGGHGGRHAESSGRDW